MIISPDCDQFICVHIFEEIFPLASIQKYNPRSLGVHTITFVPRELFNMIQLQVISFNPYTLESIAILNQVPATIRKNLRNVNYASMRVYYTNLFTEMTFKYLNGGIYGASFGIWLKNYWSKK